MPESVTDRPTRSHEYLFLLAKSKRYYYDADAIRVPYSETSIGRYQYRMDGTAPNSRQPGGDLERRKREANMRSPNPHGRNCRTVWTVATTPYKEAHFATFPEALVEPCILAGSSPQACEACGAPWGRVVERQSNWQERKAAGGTAGNIGYSETYQNGVHGAGMSHDLGPKSVQFVGFFSTCACPNVGAARCIVLDPFAGSGTTMRVAERLRRDSIGIELNPAYVTLQERRTDGVQTAMVEVFDV